MGGEMVFSHIDKPIEDLTSYENLVKNMEDDCKKTLIPIINNPITLWSENESIKRNLRYEKKLGNDDDYLIGIDLGRSLRNPDNHYFILFPKNPNLFKVVSHMHARGLISVEEYNSKEWIHPWLIKFVVAFPGVFELYYGDGYSGYADVGETKYSKGRDYPVERGYTESWE